MIKGRFDGKFSGYGFVIPEDGTPDIFIPPGSTGIALDGDLVLAIKTGKRKGKWEGKIIKVLKRGRERFVGRVVVEDNIIFIEPFDKDIPYYFYPLNAKEKKLKQGEVVLFEIAGWTNPKYSPPCRVIRRVRKRELEKTVLEEEFSLKKGFPEKVLKSIEKINVVIKKDREDWRKQFAITIDPEDAKDFDDAIALEKKRGYYYLYVHIADVSAFVEKGSSIDREAEKRGCTVYLPNETYFMLPAELTKRISLLEGEDKPVMSVVMKIDVDGEVRDYWIKQGIMRNAKRLTYKEAEKMIKGKGKRGIQGRLKTMMELADVISSKKARLGRLDFKLPEVKVVIENGEVAGVFPVERLNSHRLVEEFMVLANETVASHIMNSGKPGIYRIHEEPDIEKLYDFARFVRELGFKLDGFSRENLYAFLKSVEGEPFEKVLNYELLRCMKRARYVAVPQPHFGLASEIYTHFTSPIRRYPDLVVHRILKGIEYSQDELTAIADHSTEMDWKAQEAERRAVEMFTLKFIGSGKEDRFIGLITGVLAGGIFVELEEFVVSGFIPISLLPDEDYLLKEKALIGDKHRFRVGERLLVSVESVDHLSGQLTLRYLGKVRE